MIPRAPHPEGLGRPVFRSWRPKRAGHTGNFIFGIYTFRIEKSAGFAYTFGIFDA